MFYCLRLCHLLINEVIVRTFTPPPFDWLMWGDIIGGFGEAATLIGICMLVRAKDNGRYSSLEWVGGYDAALSLLRYSRTRPIRWRRSVEQLPEPH